jgi:hypothetical protein
VIVGIHEREGNEWFASTDVSHAHEVRDERDLAQHCQRADLSDIEESLDATARKEVLVEEVDEVETPESNSKELSFLQVDWKELRDIHRRH